MPILATMGLKKIYIAPAMTDGSMPAKGNQWLDLGDVYQDTCNLKDDSPEITEHKSETSSKVITLVGETPTNVELSLMDPDLELLWYYCWRKGQAHLDSSTKIGIQGVGVMDSTGRGLVYRVCQCAYHPDIRDYLFFKGYLPCAYDYQVPIKLASKRGNERPNSSMTLKKSENR